MESSLAMRLRSDERVIELKADFQIAVRLLQSQKKKKICHWRANHENLEEEKEKLVEEMFSEIENDYAREEDRRRELNNENQLTKYIDTLQNESLGIHRGAGIPDLKTKQAQTEN